MILIIRYSSSKHIQSLYFSSPESCFNKVRNREAVNTDTSLLSPQFPGKYGAVQKFTIGIPSFHFFHTSTRQLHNLQVPLCKMKRAHKIA